MTLFDGFDSNLQLVCLLLRGNFFFFTFLGTKTIDEKVRKKHVQSIHSMDNKGNNLRIMDDEENKQSIKSKI